ncbi:hypothetical protein [Streptomyces sp. NPDC020917]|uniref:hypothetical protein n=1 Tax=Streptomyces sp. NPDC020917 TaxID=3365102 RepID=UPI0037A95054
MRVVLGAVRARRPGVEGHLLDGVTQPVLDRAFDYWKHIDAKIGRRIEEAVRAKLGD